MGLPNPNPIDTQIFHRGAPISPLGTTQIHCEACGGQQKHERYRIIVTAHLGFGAPIFIAPFKKRASTKGKLGKRAIFVQCHSCTSLWAEDEKAKNFSFSQWGNPAGWISESKQYEMLNQEFQESEVPSEIENAENTQRVKNSKVRKLPPE